MNWRSKRKISRQKYHPRQEEQKIISENNNFNNNSTPNNHNSENPPSHQCSRTVSSKSTADYNYSTCKQTAEYPSHCNVSQSSPSPYLFHFLVLVLITFAHCAGKIFILFFLILVIIRLDL